MGTQMISVPDGGSEPGAPAGPRDPGVTLRHELLDRAALAADVVERHIRAHPACASRRDWSTLADRAVTALRELFQEVVAAQAGVSRVPGNFRPIEGDRARLSGEGPSEMAYSEFSLERACRAFGLVLNHVEDLFSTVPESTISPHLRATLDENVPLALAIHTEKARSELIVAPILVEVRKVMGRRISLFSGITFTVAPEIGLTGVCDFLLANSPVQLFLQSPVLAVVEAKDDNIKSGLGQCVAEMVAARMFNEREGDGPSIIHGLVTTGSLWQFLKLDGSVVSVDRTESHLADPGKILGILLHCVGGSST